MSVIAHALIGMSACVDDAKTERIAITLARGRALVTLDGDAFTTYVPEGQGRPILYPVLGPGGIAMTRHHPMRRGVDNEADDHPHHTSLWFAHGDVNGVDFWSTTPSAVDPGQGTIIPRTLRVDGDRIVSENEWRAADGRLVCTDTRWIRFAVASSSRIIDYTVRIEASRGDVTFGDTKEGTMAVRTHPLLRLEADPRRGNHTARGRARNSEGVEGRAVWGKRARWVDYAGTIDGRTVGLAMFDHPSNPRHPTWWHARTYGLVAANPFGVHDFEGGPRGRGDLTVEAGASITFRYRFLLHEAATGDGGIAEAYAAFAATLPEAP